MDTEKHILALVDLVNDGQLEIMSLTDGIISRLLELKEEPLKTGAVALKSKLVRNRIADLGELLTAQAARILRVEEELREISKKIS